MYRRAALSLAVLAMSGIAIGCAITDYVGHLNHQTQSEARLWGSEIAFITGDPSLDGTYAYTVKYDCRGSTCPGSSPHDIDIVSYRNPVFAAFSRDGIVDRDGDDIQGRAGSLTASPATPAGKFQNQYFSEDKAPGCQFFANVKKSFGTPPVLALCFGAPQEEVDKDLSLQGPAADDFTSLDDMVSRIWSGALGNAFTMEVASIELNGTNVALSMPFSFDVEANGIRPITAAFNFDAPGGGDLLQAILENTVDGEPVTVALNFAGGMRLAAPVQVTVVFDHDQLEKML